MRKEQLIIDLYALRTGVSALYVKAQKYNEYLDATGETLNFENRTSNRYNNHFRELIDLERRITTNQDEITRIQNQIKNLKIWYNKEYELNKLESSINNYEETHKSLKQRFLGWVKGYCISFLIFGIIGFLIGLFLKLVFRSWTFTYILLGLVCLISLLAAKGAKWGYESNKEQYEKYTKKLRDETQSYNTKIEKFRNELYILTQKRDSTKHQIEQRRDEANRHLPQLKLEISVIKQSLNEVYDSILDERDWENVDLIIYCFETGRANTMKEALLLVDKQKQVNSIVGAINEASRNISASINTCVSKLGDGIQLSLNNLNSKIAKIEEQKIAQISAIKGSVKQQNKLIEVKTNLLIDEIKTSSYSMTQAIRENQRFWEN